VITDQIGLGLTSFTGAYSASDRLIAYRRGGQGADGHQLTWFDRSGRPGETIDAGLGLITSFSLTRDERMLLVGKFTRANTISEWLYDLTRHASQQILHDANERISFDGGAWAPDEKTFIYASAEAGRWMIYERQIDGQHDRPVIAGTVMQYPRPLQLVAYLSTGQWALVNTIDK